MEAYQVDAPSACNPALDKKIAHVHAGVLFAAALREEQMVESEDLHASLLSFSVDGGPELVEVLSNFRAYLQVDFADSSHDLLLERLLLVAQLQVKSVGVNKITREI